MTICEYFKNQYDNAVATGAGTTRVCYIDQEKYPRGSWDWVNAAAHNFFGGAYQPRLEKAGITIEQLRKAKEDGFLKYRYYSSWMARQRGETDLWQLTNKGLKALYKAYEGQW